MAANKTVDRGKQAFSKALVNALVKALTKDSGLPWQIAAVPDADSAPDGSEPVRIMLALSGSLKGEVHLEFHRAAAGLLASKLLGHQGEEFGAEQSEALLKMVRAGAGEFQAALAPDYGEFTITVSSSSEPPPDLVNCEEITVTNENTNRASILMYFSPLLAEALSPNSKNPNKAVNPESAMPGAAKEVIPDQVNLDLVMDVELNVTLRFGQRQLTLREVLDLTTGSVIELDRQVEEPVELLLENKVIARGEAVVIDGNYGLRVTEVLKANFSPTFRSVSQA
jgi:flagellar motor switch protein FliN/FliY